MLKELVENYVNANKELQQYFTNKSISVDERWSEFSKLPEKLKKIDRGMNIGVPEYILQDMNIDKGTVLSFSIFVENLEYMKEEASTDDTEMSHQSKAWLKKCNIDEILEKVMANGYHDFVYTW